MEKLFFWAIGRRFLLVLHFLGLAAYGGAFAAPSNPATPNPEPAQFPNSWVLLLPLALLAFDAWIFWGEWKRQNPGKKTKVKSLDPSQLVILDPPPIQRTRKRTSKEREKILV